MDSEGKLKEKETKSVVNFSFDTVFQDKWQLLTSQDSLLIIKDFLNYLIKNMYLFFHFIYFPKPLSSKPWSAWVPVTMTSHSDHDVTCPLPSLPKHSLLFAFNQSAGWLWGQARSLPQGWFPKDFILQTFPLFNSMQTGSAFTRWGFILLVNDIKYSKDTFWVKLLKPDRLQRPSSEMWTCLHLQCQGPQKGKVFFP